MTPAAFAVFVSPHGFGHAARASAVMRSVADRIDARFQLFATTPRWFFDEVVPGRYDLHEVRTDVGFVQRSSLEADIDATVAALDDVLPFDEAFVGDLARRVQGAGCRAVLCDIAPLGVAVAARAGVPSVLLESFTWPWLYEPFFERAPALRRHAAYLAGWFRRADVHVQTEPLCADVAGAVRVGPVARPPRTPPAEVRRAYEVPDDAPLVVLTMGGVAQNLPFLDRMEALAPVHVVVTGAPATYRRANVRALDAATRVYMPDLVGAADAVVAKLGYSTVAEVWAAGRPLARFTRDDSREMGPLGAWVDRNVPGFTLEGADFEAGRWLARIPELLAVAPGRRRAASGAAEVAELLLTAGRPQGGPLAPPPPP